MKKTSNSFLDKNDKNLFLEGQAGGGSNAIVNGGVKKRRKTIVTVTNLVSFSLKIFT